MFRDLKLLYVPIAKNACSLLKITLLEQTRLWPKFLASPRRVHRFIGQRQRFQPDLGDWENPRLRRIVLLREPLKRLVSAYLDKFVWRDQMEPLARRPMRQIQRHLGSAIDEQRGVTFREFAAYVCRTPDHKLDPHWRPQAYKIGATLPAFDLVGVIEQLPTFLDELERMTGRKLRRDVEEFTGEHALPRDRGLGAGPWADMTRTELRRLKGFPDASLFYDSDLESRVRERFAADFRLYAQALARSGKAGKAVKTVKKERKAGQSSPAAKLNKLVVQPG